MRRPVKIENDENCGEEMTTGHSNFAILPIGSDPASNNSERAFDCFPKGRNPSVLSNVLQNDEQSGDLSKTGLSLKRSLSATDNNSQKVSKLAIERSVAEEAHRDHDSNRGEIKPNIPNQTFPKENNAAQLNTKSMHEEMKPSSLHTLAMACEKLTADTESSVNRLRESEPKDRVDEQSKIKSSDVPPLPDSQDVTKPYSNLSNEWVVPSKPTSKNILPVDNLSVTSPISINDVLCGRGGLTNHHPGNIFFRKLVRHYQGSYLLATKRDKAGVAKGIVETIRSLQPAGRFLKKARANGVWVEIGDRKAREKTSQALRERAPEIREELECQVRQQQQQQEKHKHKQHKQQPQQQQQQPYFNIVSSDEKTPLDFCIGRKNQAIGDVVVGPRLSNALVGPNVVLSPKTSPKSIQLSPQEGYMDTDRFSSSHDLKGKQISHENVCSLFRSRPNSLSREVTLDNVHSSLDAANGNISKYSLPNEAHKKSDDNEKMCDTVILQGGETIISNARLIHADTETFPSTYKVLSRENVPQRKKEDKDMKAEILYGRPTVIPLVTPSTPCGFQANVGIRTISSSEDELFAKEQNGAKENVCEKSPRGGPRIKTLKERIQNVL